MCSPRLRSHFKKFTERNYPGLAVLSYNEVIPQVKVQSIGVVSSDVSLDTNLEPLTLPVKKVGPVKLKILNEIEAFLSRVLPEEVVQSVVNGKCIQSIFKKLGM